MSVKVEYILIGGTGSGTVARWGWNGADYRVTEDGQLVIVPADPDNREIARFAPGHWSRVEFIDGSLDDLEGGMPS